MKPRDVLVLLYSSLDDKAKNHLLEAVAEGLNFLKKRAMYGPPAGYGYAPYGYPPMPMHGHMPGHPVMGVPAGSMPGFGLPPPPSTPARPPVSSDDPYNTLRNRFLENRLRSLNEWEQYTMGNLNTMLRYSNPFNRPMILNYVAQARQYIAGVKYQQMQQAEQDFRNFATALSHLGIDPRKESDAMSAALTMHGVTDHLINLGRLINEQHTTNDPRKKKEINDQINRTVFNIYRTSNGMIKPTKGEVAKHIERFSNLENTINKGIEELTTNRALLISLNEWKTNLNNSLSKHSENAVTIVNNHLSGNENAVVNSVNSLLKELNLNNPELERLALELQESVKNSNNVVGADKLAANTKVLQQSMKLVSSIQQMLRENPAKLRQFQNLMNNNNYAVIKNLISLGNIKTSFVGPDGNVQTVALSQIGDTYDQIDKAQMRAEHIIKQTHNRLGGMLNNNIMREQLGKERVDSILKHLNNLNTGKVIGKDNKARDITLEELHRLHTEFQENWQTQPLGNQFLEQRYGQSVPFGFSDLFRSWNLFGRREQAFAEPSKEFNETHALAASERPYIGSFQSAQAATSRPVAATPRHDTARLNSDVRGNVNHMM